MPCKSLEKKSIVSRRKYPYGTIFLSRSPPVTVDGYSLFTWYRSHGSEKRLRAQMLGASVQSTWWRSPIKRNLILFIKYPLIALAGLYVGSLILLLWSSEWSGISSDTQKENPTRSMRRGKLLTVGSIICHQKCNFIRSSQPGLQLPWPQKHDMMLEKGELTWHRKDSAMMLWRRPHHSRICRTVWRGKLSPNCAASRQISI